MASVSIAARESLRVSTVSLLSSQERSSAVRNVHLPPMRTRLTPRGAYSSCRRASAARTSTPCGSRAASVLLVERLGGGEQHRLQQPQLLRPRFAASCLGLIVDSSVDVGMITCILARLIACGLPFA